MSAATPQSGPIVLAILDGWGVSPTWRGNAVAFSEPPAMQQLWREYPHTVLHAYQPSRQSARQAIGSSDISHAMIGTGRSIDSDLIEISEAVRTGLFDTNSVLVDAFAEAAQKHHPVHLIGLASNGGIHSELSHLYALLRLARRHQVADVQLHLITDGRDVTPTSAVQDVAVIETYCQELGVGSIVSMVGRYYAMDRDQHWERTLIAYRLWIEGRGQTFGSWREAIHAAYQAGLSDEFLPPSLINSSVPTTIRDHETVILWNTRADRLRQLAAAFVDPAVFRPVIRRQAPFRQLEKCVSLVSPQLAAHPTLAVAFPPAKIQTSLGEILSGRGLRQLRVAESEKSAHVTYFFNGGREEPFPNEDRLFVPSLSDRSLRRKPAGATPQLIRELCRQLTLRRYDFAVVNLANVDLVSHQGDLFATAAAVRSADMAIDQLHQCVRQLDGQLIITADHGNAEQMIDLSGDRQHRHSINPVPFILVDQRYRHDLVRQATLSPMPGLADIIRSTASLRDIAPTILELLGLPIPVVMTGQSLLDQLKVPFFHLPGGIRSPGRCSWGTA